MNSSTKHTSRRLLFCSVILLGFITLSCYDYTQDQYEEYYVIESYQVVGRQLDNILLTFTSNADEFYDVNRQSVSGANVRIHLLEEGPGSAIDSSFSYFMNGRGNYSPVGDHVILPSRTYELVITFDQNSDEIRTSTTTPGSFEIAPLEQDTAIYQSEDQFQLTVSPSEYPGRQNVFVANAVALDPAIENFTPFYLEAFRDGDDDVLFYSKISSGLINEGNFQANPDGSVTLDYPWIGIAFYERNLLVISTVDDNLYDFVRSQEVQLGGATLSPGEIQNVIYNIEGGIGVFGSMASDTVEAYIARNPAFGGN